MTIVNSGGAHGFQLIGPQSEDYIPNTGLLAENRTITRTFTLASTGQVFYFCTQSLCGVGHGNMSGQFLVGSTSGDEPPDGRGY
jgi:heme/copper-type cytochrome/quinol oxidase subunit 2